MSSVTRAHRPVAQALKDAGVSDVGIVAKAPGDR